MIVDLNEIEKHQQQIGSIRNQLYLILQEQTRETVFHHTYANQNLLFQLQKAQHQIDHVWSFLNTSYHDYHLLETQLKQKADRLSANTNWHFSTLDFQKNLTFKNASDLTFDHQLVIGFGAVGSADFALARASHHDTFGNFRNSVNFDVGHIGINGKGTAILFKDGKFQPHLEVDAEIRGSVLEAKEQLKYQNDIIGLEGNVTGYVGTAAAQVKAIISKDEITMKAEYGVAALSGKAQGRISIFGFHIDASVKGNMLAFSGGAEFSKGKDFVEIGGEFSLFAGLGFKIRVSRD